MKGLREASFSSRPPPGPKKRITVSPVAREEFLDIVSSYVSLREARHVVTLNSLMLLEARQNPRLLQALWRAHLVVPESVGVVWALGRLWGVKAHSLAGIDLVSDICRLAAEKSWRVFFLGAAPGMAGAAAARLKEDYPALNVAGTHDGYFSAEEEDEVFLYIKAVRAQVLFVALDSPRQEIWISEHLPRLGAVMAMGVGGSFDVISGRLKRAPEWMRALGLEWLFRVLQEPRRLGRVLRLTQFVLKVHRKTLWPL